MKLLDRYIVTTILQSTFVVLLVLFGVSLFVDMSNELHAVGRGDYTVFKALAYVLLKVPNEIYLFFPMAALLGALVGLGVLSTNGELVSMRAAGMSMSRIMRAVIVAACILSLIMAVFGEGLLPAMNKKANDLQTNAMYGREAIATKNGLWMHINNEFIHVRKVMSRQRLSGVTRYQFNGQHQLEEVDFVDRLTFRDGAWRARKMSSSLFSEKQVQTNTVADQVWELNLNPNVLAFGLDSPSEMSLISLVKYIHYRENIGLPNNKIWLLFWQRAFQPLAVVVMILLAMPFVFGSIRSGAMGHRLLVGIIWGLGFYFLTQFFGQLSLVYSVPAIVGALLPILVFASVGFLLMKRVR
jgi:lipopolysaccharide export system permease protein